MRYLSVCSGIEAASVAWEPLGWQPAAFSEINKQASAVLAHHYPGVPNAGDFTTIKGDEYGTIELIIGGTPCQSFSVAGLRGGMDDSRGNLALEFLRLINRVRPRWIIWENVPGVLSSLSHDAPDPLQPDGCIREGNYRLGTQDYETDENHAFSCFISGLQEFGYSCAWRILDAKNVRVQSHPRAVPQRRRRLFVVGYLGDWRPPVAVLFEPESMRRPPAPNRTELPERKDANDNKGFNQSPFCDTRRGFTPFDPRNIGRHSGGLSPLVMDAPTPTLLTANPVAIFKAPDYVRYLSPVESERAMGFPDNYTNVEYKGEPMSDTARWRMLGNSMAINVMSWIGERIQKFETLTGE